MPQVALKVGDAVPAFALPTPRGADLTPDAFQGQPLVLAFVAGFVDGLPDGAGGAEVFDGPHTVALNRARAELRALGAALVAVSPRGLWCFRPDDDLQVVAPADAGSGDAGRRLREAFGIPNDALGLLVLGDGRVQFVDVAASRDWQGGRDFVSLVDALAEARGRVFAARPFTPTRRQVLMGSLVSALAAGAFSSCHHGAAPAPPVPPPAGADLDHDLEVTLTVNGEERRVRIDPRTTLLDALRERMGLTGSKKGCDQGQCGACTVLMDERRVKSCLVFAVAAEGSPVVTVEGLAHGETLHPVQAAFVAEDGFQCGYCTPGQIVSAVGLLRETAGAELSDEDVRERMSGNICRCGAYPNIVAAIQRARKAGAGEGVKGG